MQHLLSPKLLLAVLLCFAGFSEVKGQFPTPDFGTHQSVKAWSSEWMGTHADDSGDVYFGHIRRVRNTFIQKIIINKFNESTGTIWKRVISLDWNNLHALVKAELHLQANQLFISAWSGNTITYPDGKGKKITANKGKRKGGVIMSYSKEGIFQWMKFLGDSLSIPPRLTPLNDSVLCAVTIDGGDSAKVWIGKFTYINTKTGKTINTVEFKGYGQGKSANYVSISNLQAANNNEVFCYVSGGDADKVVFPDTTLYGRFKAFYAKFDGKGVVTKVYKYIPYALPTINPVTKELWSAGRFQDTIDISMSGKPYMVNGDPNKKIKFFIAKHRIDGSVKKAIVFENNFDSGGINHRIYFSGDSLLSVFGAVRGQFDVDPSPKKKYIKSTYSHKDSNDFFIAFFDTSLSLSNAFKFNTKNTTMSYGNCFTAPGKKMVFSGFFRRTSVDFDFNKTEKWLATDDSMQLTVAIYHLDKLGSIDSIKGPKKVCWSEDSIHTFNVPAVKNAYWYDWFWPKGTQVVGPDSQRIIRVKFTQPFGLSDVRVTAKRNTQSIGQIHPITMVDSSASLSFLSGSAHVCVGDSVLLTTNKSGSRYVHFVNGLSVDTSTMPYFGADTLLNGDEYYMKTIRPNSCLAQTQTIVFDVDTPVKPVLFVPNGTCEGTALNIRMFQSDTFYLFQNQKRIYKGPSRTYRFSQYNQGDTFYAMAKDSHGCISPTDTFLPTFNNKPAVFAGSDTAICLGDSVKLAATGAASYKWSPAHTNGQYISPKQAGTFIVEGTSSKNCKNQDTIVVGVNQLPSITTRADTAICKGDSLRLTAKGAVSYNWSASSHNAYYTPLADGYIHVTGTDQNGCKNSDSFEIKLRNLPTVNAGSDIKTCLGDSARLYTIGNYTYQWSTGLPNGHYHKVMKQETIWLRATDKHGCQNIDSLVVQPHPIPQFTLTADTILCEKQSTTIEAFGPHQFIWSDGVVNGQTITPKNPASYYVTAIDKVTGCKNHDSVSVGLHPKTQVLVANDTSVCFGETVYPKAFGMEEYQWSNGKKNGEPYTTSLSEDLEVIGTDINGCQSKATFGIIINPLPKPNLGSTITMSQDDTLVFNPGHFSTYKWHDGSTDSIYQINGRERDTGRYEISVRVEDTIGCVNSDSIQLLITPTGLDNPLKPSISLYPNPVHNVVNIISNELDLTEYQISDNNGRLVMKGEFSRTIVLNSLPAGVYLLQVFSSSSETVYRTMFVKE